MTSTYIWVRSIRLIQYFLPISNFSDNHDPFMDYYDICIRIIEQFLEKNISYSQFLTCCEEKIGENHAEAIFQNAKDLESGKYSKSNLIYSLIMASLQYQNNDSKMKNRSEIILSRFSQNFYFIFKLLFQLYYNKILTEKEILRCLNEEKVYGFLDEFLEGTIRRKSIGSTENKSSVLPFSSLGPAILQNSNGIHRLCEIIDGYMILDPFHIGELPFDKGPLNLNSFRRSTLAHNSRRVVHIHNINKIELLRKPEFANIHLRICHDKPKASFIFVPLRCESVFLDSLSHCRRIVLGGVQGIVVVQNCSNIELCVSCRTLILVDCRHVEVNLMSPNRPIIQNCYSASFSPFNSTYQFHLEILNSAGRHFDENKFLKEPINFGNSSWKFLEISKFLCQLTPVYTSEADIMILLASLPDGYRSAAERNLKEAKKKLNSTDMRISDVISNRDLIYLKSKIDKNNYV